MNMRELSDFINMNEKHMIDDLAQLIAIPSVSANQGQVLRALEWTLKRGREYGFETRTSSSKQIGIIEYGKGNEVIGTAVHVDVVPEGERSLWETDPFQAAIREGKLFGRGAYDNKGALIAVLYALKAVKEWVPAPQKKIRVIVGTQEEVEWTDMEAYQKEFSYPDYGFTPDGGFPLENTEKGYIDAQYEFTEADEFCSKSDCDGSAEGIEIVHLWAGFSKNTVPEVAEAIVEGRPQYIAACLDGYSEKQCITVETDGSDLIKLTAKGRSSHSSVPEEGDNALWHLAELLCRMNIKPSAKANAAHFLNDIFVNDYYGRNLGLEEEEYYEGIFVHRTTVTPTWLRVERNTIKLSVNLRTRYGTNREQVETLMQKAGNRYGMKRFLITDYDVPVFVKPDEPFVEAMANAYEQQTGKNNVFSLGRGTTYAKALPNTVVWGPLEEGGTMCAHQANEYIKIDSLKKAAEVYARFYIDALSTSKSLKK